MSSANGEKDFMNQLSDQGIEDVEPRNQLWNHGEPSLDVDNTNGFLNSKLNVLQSGISPPESGQMNDVTERL